MKPSIRNLFLGSLLLGLVPEITACTSQSAETRGVDKREGLARKMGIGEIVIFYANETSQSQMIQQQYTRIVNAAMSAQQLPGLGISEKSTLGRIARSYSDDAAKFAQQVEKDARGLESRICGLENASHNTGLFIFSNRLARAGKARFCLQGKYSGSVEEVDFNVDLNQAESQDFRYAEMPLSSEKSLSTAIEFVKTVMQAKGYAPSDFAYILISKSHGGGDYVIAPKLSYRSDLMSNNDLVNRYAGVAGSVASRDIRVVDLILPDGRRLGDVIAKGINLESLGIPGKDGREIALKLGDLKLGDLDLGQDQGLKVGDLKIGDLKIGDLKIGDLKAGDLKIGDLKVGDLKTGDLKTGDLKIGDLKIGDLKVGDLKSGDLKISDLKIGDLKVGDLKSGDLKNDLGASEGALDAPGVTKRAMVQILKGSALAFPLVFFESCDSDLGADLTYDLLHADYKWNGSSGVESVYFSDRKGLSYETVNYGGMTLSGFFSRSLKATLDTQM